MPGAWLRGILRGGGLTAQGGIGAGCASPEIERGFRGHYGVSGALQMLSRDCAPSRSMDLGRGGRCAFPPYGKTRAGVSRQFLCEVVAPCWSRRLCVRGFGIQQLWFCSRSVERRIPGVCQRRATTKPGKSAPARRVARKIWPYFVIVLDLGATKAFGLCLVWPDFRQQRRALLYVDTT